MRLTAQRLIRALLPRAEDAESPAPDLDLTNATLEYFDLSDRRIGTLTARHARLFHDNTLSRCVFTGPVWLTGTTIGGPLPGVFRCQDTVFHQRAQFSGVEFGGPARFDRSVFHGRTRFDGAAPHAEMSFVDCWFSGPLSADGLRGTVDFDALIASARRAHEPNDERAPAHD